MDDVAAICTKAIAYAIRRVQTDPDFRHYMLDTETLAKLCEAYAALKGESVDEVRKVCRHDMQPEHRRRKPDVVICRDRIDRADRILTETQSGNPDEQRIKEAIEVLEGQIAGS